MRVISKRALKLFWERHPPAERPLRAWHTIVRTSAWASPADVRRMFGRTVDFVADNRIIFDIGGNKYRVVVHVAYLHQKVFVKFVGTHSEYDRVDAGRIGKPSRRPAEQKE